MEEFVEQIRRQVGRNIRALRRSRQWTQADLAQQLGCSRRRVNRIEQGYNEFFMGELMVLAELFDVSLTLLVSNDWELHRAN